MSLFEKGKFVFIFMGLVMLTVWAGYHHTLAYPFQFDDSGYIVDNIKIRDVTRLDLIWHCLAHPVRFVAFYSFALNYACHQLHVQGYHVFNLFIHGLSACVVGGLSYQLAYLFLQMRGAQEKVEQKAKRLALAAALIFAAHPVQTGAVTYICQRFASLATFFYVSSLFLYVLTRRHFINNDLRMRISWQPWMFFGAAMLLGGLGMMTKQITFTLPLMVGIFEVFLWKRGNKIRSVSLISGGLALLMLLVIPFLYQFKIFDIFAVNVPSNSHHGDQITYARYVGTQVRVVAHYVKLFLMPQGQNLDYDFPLSLSVFTLANVKAGLLLLIVAWVAWVCRRRQAFLSFALIWFFIALMVESLIPIQHVIFEHRLYLPSVGLSMAAAYALAFGLTSTRRWIIGLMGVVMALSVMTYQRNRVWQSPLTLWGDALRKSPYKARPYSNLGYALAEQGAFASSLVFLNAALERDPAFTEALMNRGMLFRRQGQLEAALEDFNRLLSNTPNHYEALWRRGRVYQALGQGDLAMADYDEALVLKPVFARAYNSRAGLWQSRGVMELALLDYNKALVLDPQYVMAYTNRALTYIFQERLPEAHADFVRALTISPDDRLTLLNRTRLWMYQKKPQEALKDAHALVQYHPQWPEAYALRAEVHQALGHEVQANEDRQTAGRLGIAR